MIIIIVMLYLYTFNITRNIAISMEYEEYVIDKYRIRASYHEYKEEIEIEYNL